MKRAIVILAAAALLCGMIGGCSMFAKEEKIENSDFLKQTQTEKAPAQDSDTETQAALTDNRDSEVFGGNMLLASQTVLSLHITINPDLVAFSDASGRIIALQPLNEDANTLLAAADVMGKPVEAGVAALLSTAHEQGFLKEGAAEIQIESSVHNGLNWTEELETALTKIVTDFETEKNLQIQLTVIPPEITETSGSFTQQAGAASVKEWDDLFNKEHVTEYYNEAGKRVKCVITAETGEITEEIFDPETDRVIQSFAIYPNGNCIEKFFDGFVTVKEIIQDAAGNRTERTFSANGKILTDVTVFADGRRSEMQYYENGKYKFIATTHPDGMVQEDSYNEEEILTLTVCRKPGEYRSETTYFSNGMPAKYTMQYDNGDYSVTEYYEAGGTKYYTYNVKGQYSEEHYREDGSVSYKIWKDADCIQEMTIDENGVQYQKNQYFSGDVTHSERHTDASGNMTYSKETYKDGTVVEQWFSGGNVTKTLVNGAEQSNS